MINIRKFRIHGDNIVECHRTLSIIAEAYQEEPRLIDSPLYAPVYSFVAGDTIYYYELFAGHGRWGGNMGEILLHNGALLREGADSYVTEITGEVEKVLFAMEYCSALPAGNNAWQRNGRALACVLAGIPYLYYAEIGGVELDSDRNIKAARVPNPVVPFSYLSLSVMSGAVCLPVYRPHPSINESLYVHFEDVFGYNISLRLIRKLMQGEDYEEEKVDLEHKTLDLVKILADDRRSIDTFRREEWDCFLSPQEKITVAENSALEWKKKVADKVACSPNFRSLFNVANSLHLKTLGASSIPICLVPQNRIMEFGEILADIYPSLPIALNPYRPLILIWMTGFKPQGDDSRPDRGLAPLARMLAGDTADVMAIIYGPVKERIFNILNRSLADAATQNGLFETIVSLCNHLIVDIAPHADRPLYFPISPARMRMNSQLIFSAFGGICTTFSEHDTDTALRQLLRHNNLDIKECICNPPGGDWSGISYFTDEGEYRWTSLPRVSEIRGKRPDHVFQMKLDELPIFIAIESKGYGRDLETDIGTKLRVYLEDVFDCAPTCSSIANSDWRCFSGAFAINDYDIVTVGAFQYRNEAELYSSLVQGNLDAVIAFEFGDTTKIHVAYGEGKGVIIPELLAHTSAGGDRLEISVHAFDN